MGSLPLSKVERGSGGEDLANCEALNYRSVFGGEFQFVGRYKDLPAAERKNFGVSDEKIMHISLPIAKDTVLMGCDSSEPEGPTLFGNTISLSLNTDSKQDAEWPCGWRKDQDANQ